MSNLSLIDWQTILKDIEDQSGEVRTIGVDFYKNQNGEFNEIINLWNKAGYTSEKVEWINYYPGQHFDKIIEEQFAKEVNSTPIRSWISCVRPGKSAPWHKDVDDSMESYKQLGTLERFTCHINKPVHGQVLLVEKDSFYMEPVGKIFKWPDYMSWHGAANCGFTNHYLYHFLGYK